MERERERERDHELYSDTSTFLSRNQTFVNLLIKHQIIEKWIPLKIDPIENEGQNQPTEHGPRHLEMFNQ